jgi:hypothetical protein
MKNWLGGVVFLCVLAGTWTPAAAQITITASDVNSQLAVGHVIVNRTDTIITSMDIGSTGSTSWDFSALQTHSSQTLTSVAVASTPFAANFPGATHALKTSLSGAISGLPGPVTGDLYLYVQLGTNLLNPGNMGSGTISIPPFGDVGGQISIKNTPADVTYGLPSTLGTKWTSTYSTVTIATITGIGTIPIDSVGHDLSYEVDAFGPMKIPGGATYDALRIRRVEKGKSVGYIFLAKNGASVQVFASDTTQPDHGTIPIQRKAVTWTGPFSTDVKIANNIPAGFALRQNFPNPFNPSTTITYEVAAAGPVSIKVYNLLGQEITTLVNEPKTPGTYRVTWLAEGVPSGAYFYKMESGSFSSTKRMIVLK